MIFFSNAAKDFMNKELNIFHFTDYRSFLLTSFQQVKNKNSSWSYEAWARKLSLGDNSSLLKIINGQRDAGPKIRKKLIEYYKFQDDEKEYFEDLIQLSKVSGDSRLSLAIMDKMKKVSPYKEFKLIDEKTFSLVSRWWYFAIRQMVKLKGYQHDSNWIAKKLLCKVTPTEVKNAIETLHKLQLISIDQKTNNVNFVENQIRTTDDLTSEAIKQHHEGMLDNAKKSLRITNVEEREIRAQSLVIRKEDLPKAKEFIRECLNKFTDKFEVENGDEVYQMQVQLFPLTKVNNNNLLQ